MFIPPPDLNLEHCDPVSGYAHWSRTYDSMLTDTVDGTLLKRFLTNIDLPETISLLDYGCGTGRNVEWLRKAGHRFDAIGVDISAHMMAIAQSKGLYTELLAPEELPARERFNLCVCILVACHMESLDDLYSYVSERLKPGGRFILIDMHPHMFYVGKGTYVPIDGRKLYIRNYVHHLSGYFSVGRSHGLKLVDVAESFAPAEWALKSSDYQSLAGHPLGIGFHWRKDTVQPGGGPAGLQQ